MEILKSIRKILFIIIVSAFVSACSSRINQDNYEKVKPGMSYQEVESILGEPSSTTSLSFGNVIGLSASWEDHHGSINVQFFNNKVKIKNFNQPFK